MSVLGSDFDAAMKQLRQTLAKAEATLDAAEHTVIALHQAIAKLTALLERIQIKP
jgi:uncharacterized protein YceH (UPF0502 family)